MTQVDSLPMANLWHNLHKFRRELEEAELKEDSQDASPMYKL